MKKVKKRALLIILLCFSTFSFCLLEHRVYFRVGKATITVWNTPLNSYIIPYKYTSLCLPKKDYIIAPRLGDVSIFLAKNRVYVISNHPSENNSFFSSNKTKFRLFPYYDEKKLLILYHCEKMGYPNIRLQLDFVKEFYSNKFNFIDYIRFPLHVLLALLIYIGDGLIKD